MNAQPPIHYGSPFLVDVVWDDVIFLGSTTVYTYQVTTIRVDVGRLPHVSYKFVVWYKNQGGVLIGPLCFGNDGGSGGGGGIGSSGANGVNGGGIGSSGVNGVNGGDGRVGGYIV
ncbi:hypothetical protein NL676_008790 [Syzygium grande]|nr:hypothetical protein NL676_008790 [Syzygium grande]